MSQSERICQGEARGSVCLKSVVCVLLVTLRTNSSKMSATDKTSAAADDQIKKGTKRAAEVSLCKNCDFNVQNNSKNVGSSISNQRFYLVNSS